MSTWTLMLKTVICACTVKMTMINTDRPKTLKILQLQKVPDVNSKVVQQNITLAYIIVNI